MYETVMTYQPHGLPRQMRVALIAVFGNEVVITGAGIQANDEQKIG